MEVLSPAHPFSERTRQAAVGGRAWLPINNAQARVGPLELDNTKAGGEPGLCAFQPRVSFGRLAKPLHFPVTVHSSTTHNERNLKLKLPTETQSRAQKQGTVGRCCLKIRNDYLPRGWPSPSSSNATQSAWCFRRTPNLQTQLSRPSPFRLRSPSHLTNPVASATIPITYI